MSTSPNVLHRTRYCAKWRGGELLVATLFLIAAACSDTQKTGPELPALSASIQPPAIDPSFTTFRVKTDAGTATFARMDDPTLPNSGDYIQPLVVGNDFPFYHVCMHDADDQGCDTFHTYQSCGLGTNTALDSVKQKYTQTSAACGIGQTLPRRIVVTLTNGTEITLQGNPNCCGSLQLRGMQNGWPLWELWDSDVPYSQAIYATSDQIKWDTSSTATVTFGPITKRPAYATLSNVAGNKWKVTWSNQDATAQTEVWLRRMGYEAVHYNTVAAGVTSYSAPWDALPSGNYRAELRHAKVGVVTTPDFTWSNILAH